MMVPRGVLCAPANEYAPIPEKRYGWFREICGTLDMVCVSKYGKSGDSGLKRGCQAFAVTHLQEFECLLRRAEDGKKRKEALRAIFARQSEIEYSNQALAQVVAMFSSDIFIFIENFVGAAGNFLYSAYISFVALIFTPLAAPRILERRYRDKETKQVGPLTLIFFAYSQFMGINVILNYYLFSNQHRFVDFLNEKEVKSRLLGYFVCGIITTIYLDALSRVFAFIATAPKRSWKIFSTSPLFTSVRTIGAYTLVTSSVYVGLSMSIWIASYNTIYKNSKFLNNHLNIDSNVSSIASVLSPIVIMILCYSSISRYLLMCKRIAPRHGVFTFNLYSDSAPNRVKLLVAIFLLYTPITIIHIEILEDPTLFTPSEEYELIHFAKSSNVDIRGLDCRLLSDNRIEISAKFVNKDKNSIALIRNLNFVHIKKENLSIFRGFATDLAWAEILSVKGGDALDYHAIAPQKYADAIKGDRCLIRWYLEPDDFLENEVELDPSKGLPASVRK